MRNIFHFFILFLMSNSAWSDILKSDPAGINQKLRIDFTTSGFTFDKENKMNKSPMDRMENIAQDHAKKIKGEVTGVSIVLNPVLENEKYSHFFSFNVRTSNYGPDGKVDPIKKISLNCVAVASKDFNQYSAACYHIKL